MSSIRVTATLDAPCVGIVEQPAMLDGPLAWAAAQIAIRDGIDLPPITRTHAADMDLPLERWRDGDMWGWQVSRAHPDVVSWTAVEIRRKPATAQMSRYTTEAKHHSGLGPHKARDTTVQAAWVRQVWWDAESTDRDRLVDLLAVITHLGAHTAIGYGHVASWRVADGPRDGWRDRPMPNAGGRLQGIRAPYWHPTRRAIAA